MRQLTDGDLSEEEFESEDTFEIVAVFEAQYPGNCAVNWDHKIKVRDRVARIQYAANPALPVRGLACTKCMRDMQFAK